MTQALINTKLQVLYFFLFTIKQNYTHLSQMWEKNELSKLKKKSQIFTSSCLLATYRLIFETAYSHKPVTPVSHLRHK